MATAAVSEVTRGEATESIKVLQRSWDFGSGRLSWGGVERREEDHGSPVNMVQSARPATRTLQRAPDHHTEATDLMVGSAGDLLSYPAAICVLCGEGDFSFGRSLVHAHFRADAAAAAATTLPARSPEQATTASRDDEVDGLEPTPHCPLFVCTSLDSEATVLSRYSDAAENIAVIRECGGIVLHDVDATELGNCAAITDLLSRGPGAQGRAVFIFNFPHHCGKGKIHVNRLLLHDFFISANEVLKQHDALVRPVRSSEIYVSLAPGQGGTEVDGVARREWGNSWQVVCRAGQAGLVCRGAFPFLSERWGPLGYASRGRRSRGNGQFHVWRAVTHVFAPEGIGIPTVCSPTWRHDMGLWCCWTGDEVVGDADTKDGATPPLDEAALVKLVEGFVGVDLLASHHGEPAVQLIRQEAQADLGLSPPATDYERNRSRFSHRLTYRVSYNATGDRALSRERARSMQLELRAAITRSDLPLLLT